MNTDTHKNMLHFQRWFIWEAISHTSKHVKIQNSVKHTEKTKWFFSCLLAVEGQKRRKQPRLWSPCSAQGLFSRKHETWGCDLPSSSWSLQRYEHKLVQSVHIWELVLISSTSQCFKVFIRMCSLFIKTILSPLLVLLHSRVLQGYFGGSWFFLKCLDWFYQHNIPATIF